MSPTMFALLREVKPETMGGSGARVRWRGPAALALVPLLLGSGAGCRTAPIHDIVDAPLPAACGKVTIHDGDQIHRNYNRLVERLAARIQREPLAPELDGLCPVNAAGADGPARIRQEAEEVA